MKLKNNGIINKLRAERSGVLFAWQRRASDEEQIHAKQVLQLK